MVVTPVGEEAPPSVSPADVCCGWVEAGEVQARGKIGGRPGAVAGSESIEPKLGVYKLCLSTAVSTSSGLIASSPPNFTRRLPPHPIPLPTRLTRLLPSTLCFRLRMSNNSQLAAKNKRRNATLSCAECRRYASSEFRAPRNIYPTVTSPPL